MSNNVELYRDTLVNMIGEADQAARSISALSDMVCHYMDAVPSGPKLEGAIYETMWVFEQLSNHQRYMLERIEVRIKNVTAVEAPGIDSERIPQLGEVSFENEALESHMSN
jgi:hypothetical protein